MRVLLIDNHDSFTWNLAHDVAAVSGEMPLVWPHDRRPPAPVQAWLETFDAVIVSPGPGSPHVEGDLGLSADAVRQGVVPVLGVCLGMQAMGDDAGIAVVRAPRPVHGEVADIHHRGTGLFDGLPDPLPMVRYHSLVLDLPVTDPRAGADAADEDAAAEDWTPRRAEPGGVGRAPVGGDHGRDDSDERAAVHTGSTEHPDLVVDAWCDGLVMGVHHRRKPQWGVQTHPESICSEHGRDLVRTFLRLAAEHNALHRPGLRSDEPTAGQSAADPGDGTGAPRHRVLVARTGTGATSQAVFESLFRGQDHAWWLDSATSGFSACGSAAGPSSQVAVAEGDRTTLTTADGTRQVDRDLLDVVGDGLGTIELEMVGSTARGHTGSGRPTGDGDAVRPPFLPGWVGYLGYEYACSMLPDSASAGESDLGTPAAVLVLSDRVVCLDGGVAWVMALADHATEAEQRAWIADTVGRIGELGAPTDAGAQVGAGRTSETATGVSAAAWAPAPVRDVAIRHGRESYCELVRRCQEQIVAGESYELCLTNRIELDTEADPFELYRRLRATSPRPFAAYLDLGDVQVLSASPERFVSVEGRVVEAKPIKGTRPRGATPEEDAALAAELAHDVKERAENLMIVDLLRNDLSRVCEPGTVHVPLLFDVETHAGVHQLVSTIRGTLKPGMTSVDVLRAALPGGSMTGAPKERSVRILRDLEGIDRGVYSGALGYVSLDGRADWSIVIRTLVHRAGHVSYGVGGAVTARSTPEGEWAEILVKARTLGDALGLDLTGRFDAPDAEGGVPGQRVVGVEGERS